MLKNDVLTIEITEDGTIKTTSDAVSGANHSNAESFLRYMATLAGGETTRIKRPDHHHHHSHDHSHSDQDHEKH